MKVHRLAAFFAFLVLALIPASADTIYSNGPINGNTDAWTINFGFIASDTFTVPCCGVEITGFNFAMWLYPDTSPGPCAHCAAGGGILTSAELSITSQENGGTSYFDQTVGFTQGRCVANQYGYNVCQESTSFNGPSLNGGTYWVNLQNANAANGDPVYWDENSGPSSASFNVIGTIPSESFTVLGNSTCMCGCSASQNCQADSTAPEPGGFVLFGSGGMAILGFLATLRRKLF